MLEKDNKIFLLACLLFLYLFPIHLAATAVDQNTRHSKGKAPAWIKVIDFPTEPVPLKSSQVNLQYLLIDSQRNWEKKTLYRHFAIKTLSKSGVERISQLNIDFNPSYSEVILHSIRIYRDGAWYDRLENARYQLIQRESDLENNVYTGELTLIYFLEDIRQDDLIEYSYSIVGSIPHFASHYAEMVFLQREWATEKIFHRFLGHPDLAIQMKSVNISIEPKIDDLSPSLREWSWETSQMPSCPFESDSPSWYNPLARIEMSQYKSWEELAQKIYPLYILPSNLAQALPSEMETLVQKWKKSTDNMADRALLALRFVQDEIRYLGIEEGMGAYQPRDPEITFQRRFGDCKDKTFLLHAFLQLMDISSTPVLVDSYKGKILPEMQPSPYHFNHIVLQVQINTDIYYVDPTISLQGGSLQTAAFPNYGWGLLVSNKTKHLTALPETLPIRPTEIDSTFTLESIDSAHLKIKSVFYGPRADICRRTFTWDGLENNSKYALSEMQEEYGEVSIDSPMEILDDRCNNIFTLIESYHLPVQKLSDKHALNPFSYTLRKYLDKHVNPERNAPYAVYYPLWVKERIHIDNPFYKWESFNENFTREHETVSYSQIINIEKNTADFCLELKHLQDHIPKHSLREYWKMVNEIKRHYLPRLTIATLPFSDIANNSHELVPNYFSIFVYILTLIIWVFLYSLNRKKRQTQDALSFHLGKFRRFYIAYVALIIGPTISGSTGVVCTAVLIISFVIAFACKKIIMRRSIRIIGVLIAYVILQMLSSFVRLIISDIPLLQKALIISLLCLYLGTSLIGLIKARKTLLEEKGSFASAI